MLWVTLINLNIIMHLLVVSGPSILLGISSIYLLVFNNIDHLLKTAWPGPKYGYCTVFGVRVTVLSSEAQFAVEITDAHFHVLF